LGRLHEFFPPHDSAKEFLQSVYMITSVKHRHPTLAFGSAAAGVSGQVASFCRRSA
jgi:hypothetical protein